MSSADLAVQVFRQLASEDFRVLNIIEVAMNKREFVPREQIQKFAKVPMDRIDFTLNKLSKLGLTYHNKGAYVGYTLNYIGYDCLAINAFVRAGVISSFGQTIGVGKEADVYTALTPDKNGEVSNVVNGGCETVAVKFHRLGRISFRQTRRKRGYLKEHSAWLFQSHLAAEKEFQALQIVYKNKVAVPKPICHNRHVIVMGIIEGGELSKWRKISHPERVLKEILRNIRKAYLKAHIIHGDLSEYNIILKPDMHVLIIDWPQYVLWDHPNASELLQRDIQNVLTFFNRRFNVTVDLQLACDYVMGKIRNVLF
ncbi:MAG: serine/threonine protein kinase [Nitrososphaerota archaeon]|jgi:RIO kinase 2|nr:AarF/UbiB family protein [Candidatus Termiticorpusculum sp.]MDR0460219.1 serine/threonine protein kinase [Nitrososphaerota archaeon]